MARVGLSIVGHAPKVYTIDPLRGPLPRPVTAFTENPQVVIGSRRAWFLGRRRAEAQSHLAKGKGKKTLGPEIGLPTTFQAFDSTLDAIHRRAWLVLIINHILIFYCMLQRSRYT